MQAIREKIGIRQMGTRSKIPFDREHLLKVKGQINSEIMDIPEDRMEKRTKRENTLLRKIEETLRYTPKTKENRLVYE